MKYGISFGLVVLVAGLVGVADVRLGSNTYMPVSMCMPGVRDYTYMWWANGFGRAAKGRPQVLCIRTGWYGLAIDVKGASLMHFGGIEKVTPYLAAVGEENDVVFGLPKGDLRLVVVVGKSEYRCVRGAVDQKDTMDFPARIIESGRVVQRCDIKQLEFENEKGEKLKAAGRLTSTSIGRSWRSTGPAQTKIPRRCVAVGSAQGASAARGVGSMRVG